MTDTPITKTEREEVMALSRVARHGDYFTGPTDVVARYEVALTAAEARIAELEKALEPFCEYAGTYNNIADNQPASIPAKYLRHALAAYQEKRK